MYHPHERDEILAALDAVRTDVTGHLAGVPAHAFFAGTVIAWGPAQHAAHLANSHERVTRGLRMASALPPATAPARGYVAVREAYLAALARAPVELLAANGKSAALPEHSTQAEVIARYESASRALRDAAAAWSEAELDERAFPHPILGAIPARDMLLFMLYHDRHHMAGMRRSL